MTREEAIKNVEFMAQAVRAARASAAIAVGAPGEKYRGELLMKAVRESQQSENVAIRAGHICGAVGLFCNSPLRAPLKQYGRNGWYCCDKCHADAIRETYNSGDVEEDFGHGHGTDNIYEE